ncbi:uncharacterized protein LOC126719705 [Quercus robur]|uniref:uncharacterized protein LOC126719705 n=1 Tax=Quercus robur TaxID=38942 RepID=UPI002162F97D|nr:uncharacterized protein LOC126719705 [Quercus robur]
MQQEINDLKRKLRRAQRRQSRSSSDTSSNEEEDVSYTRRSRTPPSETFSYEKESRPERRCKSPSGKVLANDAMNKALDQVSKSPFAHRIEGAKLPRRLNQPTFAIYNGRADPVEHVSQFNQRMTIHSQNEALMCKVFPSSLGPVAMRWFNSLKTNSIDSYRKLTQAFCSRFITNSRVPRPLSSLLSLSMHEGETLKAYSDRYWEMYNEMDESHDDVSISTFKSGLPTEHGLRKSLTGKPVTSVRQLMDRINKYKRVEEDQLQGRGKEKIIPPKGNDYRSERYNNNQSRKDFSRQARQTNLQTVNVIFRELVQQVLERVKNEPFFKWPSKMAGDPLKRNQNLYCHYHQDHGYTTEDCRNLWNHLDQLVREGKLRHLLHPSSGHLGQAVQEPWKDVSWRPPTGTIHVILAAPGRTGSFPSGVLSVARLPAEDGERESKRSKKGNSLILGFSDEDKGGTI